MKNTQFARHLLRDLGIFVFIISIFSTGHSYGQDYNKVIEVVQKMENNLRTQIAAEQRERKVEIAELREKLELLQKKAGLGTTKGHNTEIKGHANLSATDAIALLEKGNARYVSGSLAKKEYAKDRNATINSQQPYVIILTCADSRVPPELIFDESIGKLFVVRDAGNIVDSVVLGSIEYAAEHLNVKLLVILGHESCGAIKATIAGGEVSPNISSLVRRLKTPVEKTKAKNLKEEKLVSACIEENVRYQLEQSILQSGVLSELVEKSELAIVGAIYDLDSGKVKFLDAPKQVQHNEKKSTSHGH